MQLNHFHTQFRCDINFFQRGIDKQADANPGNLEPSNGRLEFFALRNDVQASFCRNFFTFFRDEADFIRQNA